MFSRIRIITPTILRYTLIFSLSMAFAFSVKTIYANWTPPPQAPPGCPLSEPACNAPINVSSSYQTKGGSVAATSLFHLYNTADNILTFQRSGAANPTNFRLGTDSVFVINNSGVDTMTLKGGNVGIGTTDPKSKLTVIGGGTGIAQLGVQGCGGNYVGLTLGQTAAPTGCSNYNILSSPTDQNLFLNRPTGYSILFRENNATQMTIASGGNVGIEETDPDAKLHIGNNVGSGDIDSFSEYQILLYDTGSPASSYGIGIQPWTMVFNSDRDYKFFRGGTNVDLAIINGNVGIGTTGPGAKLDVAATGVSVNNPTVAQHLRISSSANSAKRLNIGFDDTNNVAFLRANWEAVQDVPLVLQSNGGNVGIGTTSPASAYKLDTVGSSNGIEGIRILNNTNGTAAEASFLATAQTGSITSRFGTGAINNSNSWQAARTFVYAPTNSYGVSLVSDYSSGDIRFYTGGGANERVRIDSSGNVGIGVTDPGQRLDIAGAMRLRPSSAPASPKDGTMYYNSTLGKFQCYQAGAWTDCGGAGGAGFWTQSGTNLYPNDLSWNVGIGTATPTATFDVFGNFAVTGVGTSTQSQPLQEAGVGYSGCVKPQEINGGYMFTADVAGKITKLWGRFGLASESARTTTVRLYQCTDGSCASGSEVASVVLNLQGSWASQSITPFSVAAGTSYVVAAYGVGEYCTDDSFNTNPDISNGLVTIKESRIYIGLPDFPPIKFESPMYGLADVTFVPSGPIKTNFTVASSGNVGIGTTSPPPSRLTVSSSGTGIAQLGVQGCGGDYVSLTLGQTVAPSGCSNYNILSSPTDQNLYFNVPDLPAPAQADFYFREANSTRVMIGGAGYALSGTYLKLGQRDVGTFGPNNETLYLNYADESGDVKIGGQGEAKTLGVTGNVSAKSFTGSDATFLYDNGIHVLRRDGDNVYLWPWGTGAASPTVVVGGGVGGIGLNTTGVLQRQGVNVCDANGNNCPVCIP